MEQVFLPVVEGRVTVAGLNLWCLVGICKLTVFMWQLWQEYRC